jgi:hypothetical protein
MPNTVGNTPDDNYQPSQVKVRAKPSIGLRIANPPVGEPGAIMPFSQQVPPPAPPPPADPVGRPVVFGSDPAIKGLTWPFHNPLAGMSGPGMPAVVGPSSVPGTMADEVRGFQAQSRMPPAGVPLPMLATGGSQLTRGPLQRGMPGRGIDPNYTPDPVAFTGLRGVSREMNSALPASAPVKHMGAADNLTGAAMPTDASAAPPQRQAPPAISLNQLRALTALLPRQPTPNEFAQRDLLSQITAQRQAMIDAAGSDPVKLAQAYAQGKTMLDRFAFPASIYQQGVGQPGGFGMVDPEQAQ